LGGERFGANFDARRASEEQDRFERARVVGARNNCGHKEA
jgi:hypothetical protein